VRIAILPNRIAIIRDCGLEKSGVAVKDYLEAPLVAELPPIGVKRIITQVSENKLRILYWKYI